MSEPRECGADFSNCEDEPIHTPASIQPHGVLFVVDESDFSVIQVSDNVGQLLNVSAEESLGRPLSHALGSDICQRISACMATGSPVNSAAFLGSVTLPANEAERSFHALVHRADAGLVVELEQVADGETPDIHSIVNAFTLRLESADSIANVSRVACEDIRRLTGCDRVIVYQFDDSGHGTVVGEDGNGRLPVYLNHRFPASDIPPQARELYRLNRVRIIPDASYRPVPLKPPASPSTGKPLDMTFSVLRSVSPVHVEYMRNMETASSMSVSILRAGKLWGLISCHHKEPKLVNFTLRALCDLLSRTYSQRVGELERIDEERRRSDVRSAYSRLLAAMGDRDSFAAALTEHAEDLLLFTDAQGVAITTEEGCLLLGATPSEEEVRELADWLFKTAGQVFSTNQLPRQYPRGDAFKMMACGVLAVSISNVQPSYVMWFRGEIIQNVQWGGDPNKPLGEVSGVTELHPRRSFATWQETVRDRSSPWRSSEVEGAAELRNAILGKQLRKAEQRATAVLESMTEGFIALDPQWRFVYMNAAAERINGQRRQELFGKNHWEVFPATIGSSLEREFRRAMNDRVTTEFENYYEPWARWFAVKAYPTDGGGICIQYRDITDQKQADHRLRESEERLRTVTDAARVGLVIVDEEHRYRFANRAYAEALGLPSQDLVGLRVADILAPVYETQIRPRLERAFAGERVSYELDLPARSNGSETRRVCAVAYEPQVDRSGRRVVVAVTDITAQKQAEEKLAERELRYRLVADAANDAIWDWNLATNHVVWNEGLRTRFGYSSEQILPHASWWVSHIHPDDVDRVTQTIHEHIDSGPDEWQADYRFRRADGSYAVVSDRGRVVRDAHGKSMRMVGSMLDLTERKRAKAALKAAEERFAFVRESSGVGFWYCDLPFDVLQWDDRVKSHFHLPSDAHVTIDTFYDRIHPDDREPIRAAIARSISDRTAYDTYFRTIDPATGAMKWIRAIGRTFYGGDGTPIRFDGVTLDVTVQKQSEEGLARLLTDEQRHGALLARVADASTALNAVLSADSVARVLSEEARSILGARFAATTFTTAEGCSQEVHAVSPLSPFPEFGDHPELAADQALALRVCEENRPVRLPASPWSRLAAPLIGHGGRNLGVVQLVADEGPFDSHDEAVLVQLAAIATVGIENARLYERLREQDRRKDEFLATLAHELRNPLAPLRTGLTLLGMSGSEPESARNVLEVMERQVAHMVRLIDDLLDVSRITRGKVKLRRELVDVSAVLAAALEVSRPVIDARRHGLFVAPLVEPLSLDADPTRLAQVVSNLLNNAAKYTPEGGRIELSAEREGEKAVIRVRDNGVGIASDMLPKVFEMFTQVGRTLDQAQGGLGIGLALVARLVEMHGGTISAESRGLGEGSTFVVRLPLAQCGEVAERSLPSEEAPTPSVATQRILVVDDNVDGAQTLALLLTYSGHKTMTAHTGPAAIEKIREFRPDIVFLDIGLPGMNGFEVAQRIRSEPTSSAVVLVALTGWGTEDDRRRTREAGFDHHLTKPVDAAHLQTLLAELKVG